MSKQLLNHDLVHRQAIDASTERLKYAIYDMAALMDVAEMEKEINKVTSEVLSFLRKEAKPGEESEGTIK